MNDHDENCNCTDCNDEMEHDQVTLTLDDGTELICNVIAIFPYKEKEYIALLPEDADEEDGEVFLYQFIQTDDDDSIDLVNIEDDNEFDEVAEAFDEFLDSQLANEMFDDDEDE